MGEREAGWGQWGQWARAGTGVGVGEREWVGRQWIQGSGAGAGGGENFWAGRWVGQLETAGWQGTGESLGEWWEKAGTEEVGWGWGSVGGSRIARGKSGDAEGWGGVG